jgi:hypothetical protein
MFCLQKMNDNAPQYFHYFKTHKRLTNYLIIKRL